MSGQGQACPERGNAEILRPEAFGTQDDKRRDGRATVRLLYVSLYCEHKDLGTLLKAMALLNRDGGESFILNTTANPHWDEVRLALTRGQDIALAQRPEIARWVQIAGPLSKEETDRLYLASDVFVFPSLTESFGFPMVEAMAYGLPIVAADTQVNREICGDAALYFRTQDPDDLAEKVRCLCGDEALRRRCREGGRARVASHFRWEEHAARLLAAAGKHPCGGERPFAPATRAASG